MILKEKSLKKEFVRFVTPTILSLLVYSLYNIITGIFVARGVGALAVSAMNIALPYSSLLFAIAILVAVGTSTLCASSLGRKDGSEADSLFSQCLTFLTLLGLVLTALMLIFMKPVSYLLGATDLTYPYVRDYLSGIAPFSVFLILSCAVEILIKTDGNPELAAAAVLFGCALNCLLAYIAVFMLKTGVRGAALANGISQLFVCFFYSVHFLFGNATLHFTGFRLNFRNLGRILPLGIPDGITQACLGAVVLLYNRVILLFLGEQAVVTYAIVSYADNLLLNLMIGVAQGSQPLISFFSGRGSHEKTGRLLKYGIYTAGVVSAVFFALTMLFTPLIVSAYVPDTESALFAFSVAAFRKHAWLFLLCGFNIVVSGFFTAVEELRAAITISFCRAVVLQGICVVALTALFGGNAVWYAPVVAEALCLPLSVFCFWRYWNTTDDFLPLYRKAPEKDPIR